MRVPIAQSIMPRPIASWLVTFTLLAVHVPGFGEENLWDFLGQQGKALDIMSVNSVAGHIVLVGAKYVEAPWPTPQGSEAGPFLPPVVRKRLYVMSAAANEQLEWQQAYEALPDVHEIFSTAGTGDQRLCVVYGEPAGDDEIVLDPVLLQIDAHGKILWAKRILSSSLEAKSSVPGAVEQIANLDTLRVLGSPDNGCVLSYVTRTISQNGEKFNLHVIHNTAAGNIKWQQTVDTQLYGKLFFVHSQAENRYVVVQTNQSRDAAIEAMMLGVPFVPQTALVGVDYSGKVSFQTVEPAELSKLWVKNVHSGEGGLILLAGKTTAAWAGLVSHNGEITNHTDVSGHEFSAVAAAGSGGYLLSRGDHLTRTTSKLDIVSDQPIRSVTTRQYLNQYLTARLPDDLPVQQIIPLRNDEYLLLYTLGGKLLKVRLNKPKK